MKTHMTEYKDSYRAERDKDKCINCNICSRFLCKLDCYACGACIKACPKEARYFVKDERERKKIKIRINGIEKEVPERIPVREALKTLGYSFSRYPGKGIFSPCDVGGCFCCAVKINNSVMPSCITRVDENMEIEIIEEPMLRVVSGYFPHEVGGVGTPHDLKGKGIIEVAGFCHGCNFHCGQCQNHNIAFTYGKAVDPERNASTLIMLKSLYGVNRIALSGGECTLNRNWLLSTLSRMRDFDKDVRLHVDTNGSLLERGYIDELVQSGMTDIGVDLKALELETFMHITNVKDKKLAREYMKNAWDSVKYLVDNYSDEVFTGIGVPYNRELISKEEIANMGEKIFKIKEDIQVCVLDYRPEFRRTWLKRPSFKEMVEIKNILNGVGLKVVIAQTPLGHIGP
ncbi:MAG: radical SAM protein [Candidatus Hydrothermarchaeota archaeon]